MRETTDTTPIHVVIGEQEFWIPANYFQFGYDKRDKKEQVFAIRAYWPDMGGATKQTIERRKKSLGHQNGISMVVHWFPTNTNPPAGKLRFYNVLLKDDYNKFEEPQKLHGLIFRKNISEKEGEHIRDLFIDNLEQPETLITCIRMKKLKEWERYYPYCNHNFNYKGLSFRMSYSRDYLPQWKEIQTKVKALIDQFEHKPTH